MGDSEKRNDGFNEYLPYSARTVAIAVVKSFSLGGSGEPGKSEMSFEVLWCKWSELFVLLFIQYIAHQDLDL